MKEAELFRQYAKEAMRWSSRKSTSANAKRALSNLACRYAQAALMSEGVCVGIKLYSVAPSPNARGDSLRSELTLLLCTTQIASIEL
jgi:hypothetical protein